MPHFIIFEISRALNNDFQAFFVHAENYIRLVYACMVTCGGTHVFLSILVAN